MHRPPTADGSKVDMTLRALDESTLLLLYWKGCWQQEKCSHAVFNWLTVFNW